MSVIAWAQSDKAHRYSLSTREFEDMLYIISFSQYTHLDRQRNLALVSGKDKR